MPVGHPERPTGQGPYMASPVRKNVYFADNEQNTRPAVDNSGDWQVNKVPSVFDRMTGQDASLKDAAGFKKATYKCVVPFHRSPV